MAQGILQHQFQGDLTSAAALHARLRLLRGTRHIRHEKALQARSLADRFRLRVWQVGMKVEHDKTKPTLPSDGTCLIETENT